MIVNVVIALTLSYFIAVNVDVKHERNDLSSYSEHYSCLTSGVSTILECDSLIGKPYDFVYQYVTFFSTYLFGNDGFYLYLLFLSFFIFISVLYNVQKLSPFFAISLLFLLTDYRFWEYGSNALRYGLALSIFMPIFYLLISSNFSNHQLVKYVKYLPVLVHTSALFLSLANTNKKTIFYLCFSFLLAVLLAFNFNYLLDVIVGVLLPEQVVNKLYYYSNHVPDSNRFVFSIPIHYALIILVGFVSTLRSWIDGKAYVYSFNIVWFLLLFAIIATPFGMGYRAYAFMLPFLSIMLSYQFAFMLKKLPGNFVKNMALLTMVGVFMIILFKNFDFIVRGVLNA